MSAFKITKDSIVRVNEIISNMESHSFHNHYHIIYDICNNLGEDLVYLEIGCFAGGSASLISTHSSVKKVFSIDLGFPIDKSIPIKNVNKFKNPKCEYHYFQSDSKDKELIKTVYNEIKEVDILFIDGDHSYDGVISDFVNFEKLVKSNGYLIFDDYLDKKHSPDVKPAVDYIVANLAESYEILGSITYDLIKETNIPDFESSNLFVLKKIKNG